MKGKEKFGAEYHALRAMISRCYVPHHQSYKNYGARGITVCDRWRNGEHGMSGLDCFIADVGCRPSDKHSIDRSDNNGNYEPENCRWATKKEQNRNSRRNRNICVNGEIIPVSEAIEKYGVGIPATTIIWRLRLNIPPDEAFSKPAGAFRSGARPKISEEQAISILSDERPAWEIAAQYGISKGAVFDLKAGRTWKHLRSRTGA